MQSDATSWILNLRTSTHRFELAVVVYTLRDHKTYANTHTKWNECIYPQYFSTLFHFNDTKLPRNRKKRKNQDKPKRHQTTESMSCACILCSCAILSVRFRWLRRSPMCQCQHAKQYGNNEKQVATESTESISFGESCDFSCFSVA